MSHIYTATFGVVEKHRLINKTPKGYRVKRIPNGFNQVVFTLKQYSGWYLKEQQIYYQQRAFTSENKAKKFAHEQIVCMRNYYTKKLEEINELENQNKHLCKVTADK